MRASLPEWRGIEAFQGLIHDAHGPIEGPPVVYLPGVHGDPSRLERARAILTDQLRLFEVTYPRAEHWNLDQYVEALDDLLDVLELRSAHLIAESFGSLPTVVYAARRPERVRSIALVAGLTRSPQPDTIGLAHRALRLLPGTVLERGLGLVSAYARGRRSPLAQLEESAFLDLTRRSRRGRLAAAARLRIIETTDLKPWLRHLRSPVSYLGGSRDQVVPVRREIGRLLRRLPPACRFRSHIVPGATHAIFHSRPREAAQWVAARILEAEAGLG